MKQELGEEIDTDFIIINTFLDFNPPIADGEYTIYQIWELHNMLGGFKEK